MATRFVWYDSAPLRGTAGAVGIDTDDNTFGYTDPAGTDRTVVDLALAQTISGAKTFTGVAVLTAPTITTSLTPTTTDGAALGSASLMFSDLFLASAGVINFNNGDVTLTHAANALTVAGGAFNFASSGSAYTFTEGTPGVAIYTTNASTSGSTSAEPFLVYNTQTGAAGVGGRGRFFMTTNVALGGWSNALKAEVTYGASGSTSGLGSAFVAEMTLSAGTTPGTYAPLEVELNVPSGASLGTLTSMGHWSVQGADVATFDTSGYLFNIAGLTVGSGKLFQANTAAAATHALRIRVGGTDYFIMLTSSGA